jgi:branched-chain amino acid transport system permease protein
MLIFAISGLLCSLASLIIAIDEGFSPHEGLESILLAIVATMIGGKNTFLGPVIGALLIGIFRSSIVWYFSAIWQNTFTFLLLAIFLLLRPQGIIGQKYRIEL